MATVKMGVSLQDMIATMSADEQEIVRVRTQELIEQELTLRDLRKAMGQTQATMAAKLGVKQENVSRVEQRADMLLSTLGSYLNAMGGKLKLTVEFEGRAPVVLAGFSMEDEVSAPGKRRRKVMAA